MFWWKIEIDGTGGVSEGRYLFSNLRARILKLIEKKVRKWEKERLRKQVIMNQPKIMDINGNVIGNMGTITGGSLVVGSKRDWEKVRIPFII